MKEKFKNRKGIYIWVILGTFLIFSMIFSYSKLHNSQLDYVYMHASWTYRYGDISELAKKSDCIARVIVKDDGISKENGLIPNTTFSVEVTNPIFKCENGDILKVYMSGGLKDKKIYEISDDPLMKKGEEYIIFTQKNADGTYTVLGGSQGRMQYKDGKISSLNIVNKQVKESSSSLLKLDNISEDTFVDNIKSYLSKP
ncbi:MAG TPA: hypothetical protein GXZ21_11790 [Clostridiales bacterium]|nr:hypothetical protein [Clostridiales bacterium]